MDLVKQVEELFLIKSSLLPTEFIEFLDNTISWQSTLDRLSSGGLYDTSEPTPTAPADFLIKIEGSSLAFRISLAPEYPSKSHMFDMNIHGNIHKMEQERWMNIVREKRFEINDAEFPVYQLLSSYLLPLVHEELTSRPVTHAETPVSVHSSIDAGFRPLFHVLLTSHHLISPQKRKSLRQWSEEHNLSGFAKVGYPGIIYCSGFQPDIQQFVYKVKSMQWLALHVKFLEPLPCQQATLNQPSWKELEKIGEVVEELKRYGRERYAYDFGIGSDGSAGQ